MTLTRKHFVKIAQIVNDNRFSDNICLIDDLSDYFKSENSQFDEEKFRRACLEWQI